MSGAKLRRNKPCACGSGQKYKFCCGANGGVRIGGSTEHRQDGALTEAGRALERFSPVRPARQPLAFKSSENGRIPYEQGIAYEQRGNIEAAVTAYRQAVALIPSLADAHARLGNLLFMLGRRPEAANSFRKAAAASPKTTV